MADRRQVSTAQACWCDSTLPRQQCCAPLLSGEVVAATAVALMRSRYSAYVNLHCDYLLSTWHAQTRPSSLQLDPHQHWLGLKIYAVTQGQPTDDEGTVEFVARYKIDGKGHRLRETSRFVRHQGCWYYHSGDLR